MHAVIKGIQNKVSNSNRIIYFMYKYEVWHYAVACLYIPSINIMHTVYTIFGEKLRSFFIQNNLFYGEN